MDITSLLIFLAIGALAGWLAGTLMKGGGFGLLGCKWPYRLPCHGGSWCGTSSFRDWLD